MSNIITIGKRVDSKGHEDVQIDVLKLILTRLLICANSGGGKSWILRRLAELLFPIMPCIIFDWEGEFATLREKFDFVLVGKGGETPADCRSAKIVILKLLELRVSAVIDLSELAPADKHRYVRLACEAAINSPKEFWRPTAFIFDEVHEVCPENGKGHSEAKQAVLAFPTKGRKRRFISIFATQRLHKLALDARAEMLNRLIGMTFEPDDLKEAASILGIDRKGMDKFKHEMRTMETGNFYAFGRAISLETILLKVGPVQTSHESEHAKYGLNAPPPTAKIKAMLPQLADLPKQAEEALTTEAELKAEVRRLKDEIAKTSKPVAPAGPSPEVIKEVSVLSKEDGVLLEKMLNTYKDVLSGFENFKSDISSRLELTRDVIGQYMPPLAELNGRLAQFSALPARGREDKRVVIVNRPSVVRRSVPTFSGQTSEVRSQNGNHGNGEVTGGVRRMMIALAQRPGLNKRQLGMRAGLSSKSGTFGTYLTKLRTNGWIEESNGNFSISLAGLDNLGEYQPLPEGEELYRYYLNELGNGGAGRMLEALYQSPVPMTKEQLGAAAGISHISGTFGTYLTKLRTLELIEGKTELTVSREFSA